jgi:hypothetical protein
MRTKGDLSPQDRKQMIDYIATSLDKLPDSLLITMSENIENISGTPKFKGGALAKAFRDLKPIDWNEMPLTAREVFILQHSPNLNKTERGLSFIKMMINNNYPAAMSNIRKFLNENKNIG